MPPTGATLERPARSVPEWRPTPTTPALLVPAEPAPTPGPLVFLRTQPYFSAPDARLYTPGTERQGHIKKGREHLRLDVMDAAKARGPLQQHILAWLRDHVHRDIPRHWYELVIGHDIHVSTYAWLHAKQWHSDQRDPFTGQWGWWEDLGLVSRKKISTAFRDFECAALVVDTTTYGDFKWHSVGTDNTAEANTQSALVADSGIARVAGTQTNPSADTYRSIATTVADSTETWEEHLLSNASTSGTGADRSLPSPPPSVVANDQVEWTYTMTKQAEA